MPRPSRVRRSFASKMAAALAPAAAFLIAPAVAAEFSTGGYSFSDELGDFRLLSATGTGTADDPVVVTEELVEVAPITLVIRNRDRFRRQSAFGQSELHLVKRVVNRSERIWAGFELELQEILGKPSDYGDGLSFKQFAAEAGDVSSDVFARNQRMFEPADRIEFLDGHVDPGESAMFRVTITDPTPTAEYYLVQDPKLLSAALPQTGRKRCRAIAVLKEQRHSRRQEDAHRDVEDAKRAIGAEQGLHRRAEAEPEQHAGRSGDDLDCREDR